MFLFARVTRSQPTDACMSVQAPDPLLANYGAGSLRMYGQDMTMLLTYNSKERTMQDLAELW